MEQQLSFEGKVRFLVAVFFSERSQQAPSGVYCHMENLKRDFERWKVSCKWGKVSDANLQLVNQKENTLFLSIGANNIPFTVKCNFIAPQVILTLKNAKYTWAHVFTKPSNSESALPYEVVSGLSISSEALDPMICRQQCPKRAVGERSKQVYWEIRTVYTKLSSLWFISNLFPSDFLRGLLTKAAERYNQVTFFMNCFHQPSYSESRYFR